jgi:hypothetical protein
VVHFEDLLIASRRFTLGSSVIRMSAGGRGVLV